MVWADGNVYPGDPQVLPITPAVAQLAGSLGNGPELLFTTTVGGIIGARDRLPAGGAYRYSNGTSAPSPWTTAGRSSSPRR